MVKVRRAKNESSLHRRGYEWALKTRDFIEDSNEEFGKSKVSGLGSVHKASWSFFYALRGREFFLLGLFSIFRLENGLMFKFLLGVLRLSEDKGLPQEERFLT